MNNEVELIVSAQKGNKKSKEELILKYDKFLKHMAWTYYKRSNSLMEMDDYYDYAVIGFLEAIKRFDVNKGVKLMTFSYVYIRDSLLDGLQNNNERFRMSRNVYRQEIANNVHVEENQCDTENTETTVSNCHQIKCVSLDNMVKDTVETVQKYDEDTLCEKIILEKALLKLNKESREILECKYYKEETLTEIANRIGLNISSLQRKKVLAIEQIRNELECVV